MDRIDEHFQVIRVYVRRDAVTQIKDVARAMPITCQHIGNALFDRFR